MSQTPQNPALGTKITLTPNHIELNGVESVTEALPARFVCTLGGRRLELLGEGFEVTKLDISASLVTLSGKVNALNFPAPKKPLLKRLFR